MFLLILQKKYDKVIDDCSKAIELNPKYIKCIQRRARAAETIENFELALEGKLFSKLSLEKYFPIQNFFRLFNSMFH